MGWLKMECPCCYAGKCTSISLHTVPTLLHSNRSKVIHSSLKKGGATLSVVKMECLPSVAFPAVHSADDEQRNHQLLFVQQMNFLEPSTFL